MIGVCEDVSASAERDGGWEEVLSLIRNEMASDISWILDALIDKLTPMIFFFYYTERLSKPNLFLSSFA